jgi:hypothetical protein
MEIGYKNSKKTFPVEKFGPWRHCDEADLQRVVGDHDAEPPGSSSRPWPTPARATGRPTSCRPPTAR